MNENPENSTSKPLPTIPGWVNVLFRLKYIFLGIALLLIYPGYFYSNLLNFNQSIESFYSSDNLQLKEFLQSRSWFGGDEILLVVWTQPNLVDDKGNLTDQGLDELAHFESAFEGIPGIDRQSTQSISTMLKPKHGGILLNAMLKLPVARNKIIKFSEGFLISEDHKTVGILLRLLPRDITSSFTRQQTYDIIRETASHLKYPAHVVGEPIQVNDMFEYVQQDGAVLGWTTMIIVTFVLLVLFKSLRWVLLPLIVVTVAIFLTRSILYFSGMELSMVSSILNSLMMIIGVATLTHLIVFYREFRNNFDRETALKQSFSTLASPVAWTTLTTIVGFASLLSSSVSPVRSFGGMVSLGTFMVMLMSLLIIPGVIMLGPVADPKYSFGEKGMSRILDYMAKVVLHYPLAIALTLLILMFSCGYGMTFLKIETDFSKNFRSSSPIVQALDFVEQKLGGAGTWELNFKAPPELDQEYIDKLEIVTQELRDYKEPGTDRPAFTKVVSLTDGLHTIPDRVLFFRYDTPEKKLAQINKFQKEFEANLYKREHGRIRIILRGYERLPAETKLEIIRHAREIASKHLEDVHATGLYVLLAYLIQSLLGDQLLSFGISASAILLMMTIAFRSLILGFICLIPNIFPLLMLMGILGWLGVPTNIGTAMIASVSLGLTVDSSIHYLNGYLDVINNGGTHRDAVYKTNSHVGLALLFANLALILGFLVLTLSNFIPLVYFGVLVSLAMLGGLIGNLILLPALLSFVYSPTKITSP